MNESDSPSSSATGPADTARRRWLLGGAATAAGVTGAVAVTVEQRKISCHTAATDADAAAALLAVGVEAQLAEQVVEVDRADRDHRGRQRRRRLHLQEPAQPRVGDLDGLLDHRGLALGVHADRVLTPGRSRPESAQRAVAVK